MALILLGYPKKAEGTQPHEYDTSPRIIALVDTRNPITITAEPPRRLQNQRITTPSREDCVSKLKRLRRLPSAPVTLDGFARSIPVKPVELKPGMRRVVRTSEGKGTGHVVEVAVEADGTIRSITEGGYPGGEGRIVPQSVIQGEVISAIPQ